jgi:hypothetical protein
MKKYHKDILTFNSQHDTQNELFAFCACSTKEMVRMYRLNCLTLARRAQKQLNERIRQKVLAIEEIPEVRNVSSFTQHTSHSYILKCVVCLFVCFVVQ